MSGLRNRIVTLHMSSIIGLDGMPGNLRVLDSEALGNLKFSRFFILDGFRSGTHRGDHAHKKCWQLFLNFGGGIHFKFLGQDGEEIALENHFPTAILVPPMIWVTLEFIDDNSKVLVGATHAFDEDDYIRDKDMFLKA
jgi:hypothetical protein